MGRHSTTVIYIWNWVGPYKLSFGETLVHENEKLLGFNQLLAAAVDG
jgi:hypothetical protein